jgi:hypothetical protein
LNGVFTRCATPAFLLDDAVNLACANPALHWSSVPRPLASGIAFKMSGIGRLLDFLRAAIETFTSLP